MALIVTKQLVVKHTEIPIDPHAADQSIGSRIDAAIVEALDEGTLMPSHTFHDCCAAIVAASVEMQDKPAHLIHYAASYAKAGLTMPDAAEPTETTDEVRVQILYILNNLATWRDGDKAKAVRQSLKTLSSNRAAKRARA